jgi:hypothetical protein
MPLLYITDPLICNCTRRIKADAYWRFAGKHRCLEALHLLDRNTAIATLGQARHPDQSLALLTAQRLLMDS